MSEKTISKNLKGYIYKNGVDDTIQQGKRIFQEGKVIFVAEEPTDHFVEFKIKDNTYNLYRQVIIRNYHDLKTIALRCSCAQQRKNFCKHTVAGLFSIIDLLERDQLRIEKVAYTQSHTLVKMSYVDMKQLKVFVSAEIMTEAEKLIRVRKAKIKNQQKGSICAEIRDGDTVYPVQITLTPQKEFITSCTCDEARFIVCKHKIAVFLQILYGYGAHHFSSIRDTDQEKKQLLNNYLRNHPDKIDKVNISWEDDGQKTILKTIPKKNTPLSIAELASLKSQIQNTRTASQIEKIIFIENMHTYPHYDIVVYIKNENFPIHSNLLNKYLKTSTDKDIIKSLQKLTHTEMFPYLATKKHFYHSHLSEDSTYKNFQALPETLRPLCFEYLQMRFKTLYTLPLANKDIYFQKLSSSAEKITLSPHLLSPTFFIGLTPENTLNIDIKVAIDKEWIALSDSELISTHAFLYKQVLYGWRENHYDIFTTVQKLSSKKIPLNQWHQVVKKELHHLLQQYHFQIDSQLADIKETTFNNTEITLQESEQYLKINLFFHYNTFKVPYDKHLYIYAQESGKIHLLKRDKEKEEALYQKILSLHNRWTKSDGGLHPFQLIIQKEEALKDRWFLSFLATLEKEKVWVKGLEQLKKFSTKEVFPIVKLDVQSGIDWLDVKININIENEVIDIDKIRNMFTNKSTFITLKNGKVISISKHWMKKYKLFFDLAEKKEKGLLRFKKTQVNLLNAITATSIEGSKDFLYTNWSKEAKRLLDKPVDRSLKPPKHLEKVIKNYQRDSFHWMQHLKKLGYNGLLGDDMGLGKTLQVLTNLAYEKQKHKKINALIICPTSLIYTWQEEIAKFTPSLTYFIYHSSQRITDIDKLKTYDIVISTYGIIRSDIIFFKRMEFDYIVLDESQYIKNPNSKIYQSVIALKSKHRICLSGTPLQNNTFDLYAQINFLNPDFLGPLQFFKNHFSLPIDKYGDKEMQMVLKNAISPLFLRRTKKEVSPELPDKNVNILYCAMETTQREIYNNFRDNFRYNLLGLIRADGIQQHKMHILQALTKLRMICNSPALLKDENSDMPDVSIKRDLLLEQIENNVGEHKIIVFSQFLGMLHLLKKGLKKRHIPFEYLDGTINAKEREKVVKKFQEENHFKVFLVSLKAGGVGLNLTAADYVYIVDPWWNPTIEMQAIDRTHRIGQTKKIFAQRMICKDTIEEKIIHLQEKKFHLTNALIEKADSSLLQNMTEEDLHFLLE